jgi:hypothetical protein
MQEDGSVGSISGVLKAHNKGAIIVIMMHTGHHMPIRKDETHIDSFRQVTASNVECLDAALGTVSSGRISILASLHGVDGITRLHRWDKRGVDGQVICRRIIVPDAHL